MIGVPVLTHEAAAASPECALIAAVLITALRDALGPAPARAPARTGRRRRRADTLRDAQSRRAEAGAWIESASLAPWSYLWCCEHCALDAEHVRAVLAAGDARLRCALSYTTRRHEVAR